MPSVTHSEESSGLLERLGSDALHLGQVGAAAKPAVLLAMRDDLLGERGADAGDVSEQGAAGGVELDADTVHAALDDLRELARQQLLIDVVLVLADTDRFRIDLHQLGQRILQATRDRDGAAHGEVEVGVLFARDVGRAVHAGARFVHAHHDRVESRFGESASGEGLGFAPAGAISNR